MAKPDFSLFVFDAGVMSSSLLPRSLSQPGLTLPTLDHAQVELSPSLKSIGQLGSPASAFGMGCLGLTALIFDSGLMGLPVLVRSLA